MTKISQWVTTMASETPGSTVSLVGQGSFLDKPSLHMVGYMGKDPDDFKSLHDGWCPVCKSKGHSQALKTYRINFTQSIFLCTNPQCIFPLGYTSLDNIIANTEDLQKHPNVSKPKKRTISEAPPDALASVKRQRTDLPILGDSLERNNFQADFSTLSCGLVAPSALQHCQAKNGYHRVDSVSRYANSFSSAASGLCEKPISSDVPMASQSVDMRDTLKEMNSDKDMLQEVFSNEVLEMDVHKIAENSRTDNLEYKDQMNFTLTSDTGVSNGDLGPGHVCFSKLSTPSPVKLVSQGKDNSPTVVTSTTYSNSYVPDQRRDLFLQSVLLEASEIQNIVQERLEDSQTRQQVEDLEAVLNAGCADVKDQHHRLSPDWGIIQNAETLSNDVPGQKIHSGSVLESDSLSTTLKSTVEKEMGDSPSDLGLSQKVKKTPHSLSLQDIQHMTPSEDNGFEVVELTLASEVKSNSVDLSTASDKQSLFNCSLAQPHKMAQECQTSHSATTNIHDSFQVILFECPSEEMSLNSMCNSPVTAVEDKFIVNSLPVSLPEHRSSEQLNLVQDCQKNDTVKSTLQNIQPLCHAKINGISVNADSVPLSDISLSEPQSDPSDSPCVASTPCRTVPPLCNNTTTDANRPSLGITAGGGDRVHMTTISLLSDSQLLEIQKESSKTIIPNSPINKVLVKDCHLDRTVIDVGDLGNLKTPFVSSSGLSVPQQDMKKTNQNPVLPDLLLDIQPEHRIEEPLSAAQDSAMSLLSEADLVDHSDLQCDKLKTNEGTEISDAVTSVLDCSTLSEAPSLETTMINECVIQDDSMDTTVTSKPDSNAPVRTFQNSQRRLQWTNKHSLCWLDCILSALVQSVVISSLVVTSDNKELLVHYLLAKYEEASTMVAQSDKKKTGGTKKFEKLLNEVRLYIFDKLKPFLKCELGQKESPVFAFPLLLKQDPEIEKHFEHSFTWNFTCELCGFSYATRYQKTMTTFTKIFPDWRPLNAHHTCPCNKCLNSDQKRVMRLEKLNSIFMVHFVEGLPTNDLQQYSFQFNNHVYEIKAVIRYRNEHFSTWIANDDGSWLESDDLKGSFCRRHQKFKVRAEDIHVVMWEKSNVEMAGKENSHLDTCHNETTSIQDQTLLQSSPTLSRQVAPAAQPIDLDTSNPLAGMEGFADDDIITLTLVEVPLDARGNPIEPNPPSIIHKEASLVVQPQSAQLIVPNTSVMLPKPAAQINNDCPPVIANQSKAKPVPTVNSNIHQTVVKQNNLTKPAHEMKNAHIAASSPFLQPFSTKKSTVGNWMTTLINKDLSILNSNLSAATKKNSATKACPPLKITDLSGTYKRAQNFDGFQAKSVNKTPNPSSVCQPDTPKEKSTMCLRTILSPSGTGLLKSGSNYGKLRDGGSSSEDRIRKLRLKLLKKLKAKKNELATLERMSKVQQSSSNSSQLDFDLQGGFNRRQHLHGFLQELQGQIDNADNESVCTMSSCTSICSSPGDAEFFAELFSPSAVDNPANDSRYLEMLADGCGIIADQSPHMNGHNFSKGSNGSQQSTSESITSYAKASTQNCSNGDESLNILSSSTLDMINEETEYFSAFDYMF